MTGSSVTVSDGTVVVTAAADVDVTGSEMATVSSGTVTITADCNVTATGSELTISTTSAGVVTWNDITTSASQTWTEIAA